MSFLRILVYVFVAISLIFEGFFGIIPLVSFFIQILLVAIPAAIILKIFPYYRPKPFLELARNMSLYLMSVFGVLIVFVLGFITYQNTFPAQMANITLQNSSGSIVFLQMSHIANSEFYTAQHQKILDLNKQGYVFLVEGVQHGTPENEAYFDQVLGFKFTKTLYDTIARTTGFVAQDTGSLYAGVSSGSLVSVDMSIDEIVGLLRGSGAIADAIASGSTQDIPIDIEAQLTQNLEKISPKEKMFLGFFFRGFLNMTLRSSEDMEKMLVDPNSPQAKLFTIILDHRNQKIVDYIHAHPDKKIAVVYGSLHFNGVFSLLQKNNKNWQVIQIQPTIPYR